MKSDIMVRNSHFMNLISHIQNGISKSFILISKF